MLTILIKAYCDNVIVDITGPAILGGRGGGGLAELPPTFLRSKKKKGEKKKKRKTFKAETIKRLLPRSK